MSFKDYFVPPGPNRTRTLSVRGLPQYPINVVEKSFKQRTVVVLQSWYGGCFRNQRSTVWITSSIFNSYGQSRPLFHLFSSFSHSNINFNKNKLKKVWMGFEPWAANGKQRRNLGAMVAAQFSYATLKDKI